MNVLYGYLQSSMKNVGTRQCSSQARDWVLSTENHCLYVTMCAVACLNAVYGCLLFRRARTIANSDH